MTTMDFYHQVHSENGLQWDGVTIGDTPTDDQVLVSCPSRRLHFSLSPSAIKETSWKELKSVLYGFRGTTVMNQVTRIVGYMSSIPNWNKSKLAELKDRHNGFYDVEGPTAPIPVPTPTPEPELVAAE